MSKKQLTNLDIRRYLPADARLVVSDETDRLNIKYVYEGLITYQQDTGAYWKYIGTPPSNLSGDWEQGIGEKGEAGTSVLTGASDPDDADGNNGDLYFQTQDGTSYSAGDWFEKTGGSWGVPVFNSIGPQGPAGADGSSIVYYGSIFNNNDTTNSQTLATAGTYYKITQFTENGPDSNGVTTDFSNDQITINNTGIYRVSFDASVDGSSSTSYHIHPRVNGVLVDSIPAEFSFDTELTIVSASGSGVLLLSQGDVVDLAVKADTTSASFTLNSGILAVSTVGAEGIQGKAFVVTQGYSDRILTDALVTEVEGLTSDTQNPIVLSILTDLRSTATKTAMGLPQTLKDHTIQWDGLQWYDNGTWRGPKGNTGNTGPAGPAGEDGVAAGLTAYYSRYFTGGSGTAPSLPSRVTLASQSAIPFRGKNVVITGYISFDNDGSDIGVAAINRDSVTLNRQEAASTSSGNEFTATVFYSGYISSLANFITLNASKIQGGPSGLLRYRDALLEIKVLD